MLRYDVRLGLDNIGKSELVWREKYVSPDLSFISGVCDSSYNLENFEKLSSANDINNTDSTLFVDAHNVIREGYLIVYGKTYPVISKELVDYSVDNSGTTIGYEYIEVNGKYYYKFTDDNYYIKDFLKEEEEGKIVKENLVIPASTEIKIDTIYWIEDGKVTIDGNEYFYDRYENGGILKYGEDGDAIDISAITECDGHKFHSFETDEYQTVTKFTMTKSPELTVDFTSLSYLRYYFFVLYKDTYCGIRKKIDNSGYTFICEIPKHLLYMNCSVDERLKPIEFKVFFTGENISDNAIDPTLVELNSANYGLHNVKELDDIRNIHCVVVTSKENCLTTDNDLSGFTFDNSVLNVCNDVMNSNTGDYIGIYLEEEHAPLRVGNILTFRNHSSNSAILKVYSEDDSHKFVFYNGKRYSVEQNICDKVVINENEYDIDYINGKLNGEDCLVLIDGEEVPFKISIKMDGDKITGETLIRYGAIFGKDEKGDAVTIINPEYEIVQYDGVIINGKRYQVYTAETKTDDENENYKVELVRIDKPQEYKLRISSIKGSSLYICSAYISSTELSDEFIRLITSEIASDIINNKTSFTLLNDNKIFGDTEITSDLAFRKTAYPKSSDDYYDLFDRLKIFIDTAYIHIPIEFSAKIANDALKDDFTQKDFYEAEKKNAINPVVDMERDVYTPKYFNGIYDCSNTDFKSIYNININFHFRTRNLDSWKVNDGSDNLDSSIDNDNWFITDFYPYRYLLSNHNSTSAETLYNTSDLMGLLYFTNDDVFYQRQKISKSFARLSFYDSTDPQTQSLLATSCVFMDEHKLFKKYIDNSRKNLYSYAMVSAPEYEKTNEGFTNLDGKVNDDGITIFDPSKVNGSFSVQNKISVFSEFLGKKKENKQYDAQTDCNKIVIDETRRLSSMLTINNKYTTETSSEGYYLYMFREYSENLHPKQIYMKIEFNHAGIGKTIPFIVPMHWDGLRNNKGEIVGNITPKYKLDLTTDNLQELKAGIPLEEVYSQTYIPLYAVYDFKNKEYAYVFDERYITRDEKTNTITLNLFEIKIKDESNETLSDDDIVTLKKRKQMKYVIDVNEQQFGNTL